LALLVSCFAGLVITGASEGMRYAKIITGCLGVRGISLFDEPRQVEPLRTGLSCQRRRAPDFSSGVQIGVVCKLHWFGHEDWA